ncbi:hypothetical protein REPUB_Repub11eG0080700 [Reevesia pubescens]
MEDDNGLKLSLGLSCGASSAKPKSKIGSFSDTRTEEGDRGIKIVDDFKNFLQSGNQKQDPSVGSQKSDPVKPSENFFNDLSKVAGDAEASVNLNGREDGSTTKNEDVAESEVGGSTSRLVSNHDDGSRRFIGVSGSSEVPKVVKLGNLNYGNPFPVQSVNAMNVPFSLPMKDSNSVGTPGSSGHTLSGMIQIMPSGNSERSGTQFVNPGNLPAMFGYSPVQLPLLDKDNPWGMVSHHPQFHPSYSSRGPPNLDKHGDGLKSSQASMHTIARNSSEAAQYDGRTFERVEAIKPGIAADLKFGGSGSYPNLPWVSTTGTGPHGRTISGVTYRFSANQIKIVCACHGTHMSPEEFVRHASEECANPDNNNGLATFPSTCLCSKLKF